MPVTGETQGGDTKCQPRGGTTGQSPVPTVEDLEQVRVYEGACEHRQGLSQAGGEAASESVVVGCLLVSPQEELAMEGARRVLATSLCMCVYLSEMIVRTSNRSGAVAWRAFMSGCQ